MKVLTAFALVMFCLTANAKIWRVNNNTNVVKDFTTLQAAHDAAASGDTVHVEGSAYGYAGVELNKKLVIIGPGYFLDQNLNLQAVAFSAIVGAFTIYAGAEGSVVMGLNFNATSVNVYSNNITIRRNQFSNGSSVGAINLYYLNTNSGIPVSNIMILQNFDVRITLNYASTNILIQNNLISRHAYEGAGSICLYIHANGIANIQNNIIRGSVSIYNSAVSNNIQTEGTLTGNNNMMSNNVGSGNQFGTLDGNKANIDMATVFITTGTGATSDGKWALKAGSPAIGAGYGSTAQAPVDCGIFGGTAPYKLSGIPPVPAIYYFVNQGIGSNSDPIDVQLKVRANN